MSVAVAGVSVPGAQVLIEGFAADAELAGQGGLGLSGLNALAQPVGLLGGEGLAAAAVGAAFFGQGDALALAFADEGALEFCEGTQDREHEVGHGGVLAAEGEVFLEELDADAAAGEGVDEAAEVVEVACQAVHAVDDHGVTLAHEGQQPFEFGAPGVLARGLVGEETVHPDLLELALGVLVEAADADVADALTVHGGIAGSICQEGLYDPEARVSIIGEKGSILTGWRGRG